MKKLFALLVIAFVVFLVIYRQRIFLRDPLGKVTRDGVAVDGTQVMINYPNDVLLLDKSAGRNRIYLVQHWNLTLGTPTVPVKCMQGVACMTDADQATEAKVAAGSRGRRPAFEGVTMTDRRVEFVDEDGALVEVVLR